MSLRPHAVGASRLAADVALRDARSGLRASSDKADQLALFLRLVCAAEGFTPDEAMLRAIVFYASERVGLQALAAGDLTDLPAFHRAPVPRHRALPGEGGP